MISADVHLTYVEAVHIGLYRKPPGGVSGEVDAGLFQNLALYLSGGVFHLPAVIRVVLLVEVAEAALEVGIIGSPYVFAGSRVARAGRGVHSLNERPVVVDRLSEHRLHKHVHRIRDRARKTYARVGSVLVAEFNVCISRHCLRLYRFRREGVSDLVLRHSADYLKRRAGNGASVRLDGEYLARRCVAGTAVGIDLVRLVVVCGAYRRNVVGVHRDTSDVLRRGGRRSRSACRCRCCRCRSGRLCCCRCSRRCSGRRCHCRYLFGFLARTEDFLAVVGLGGRLKCGVVLAEYLVGRFLRLREFIAEGAVCTHHHFVGERHRRHIQQIYLHHARSGLIWYKEVKRTLTLRLVDVAGGGSGLGMLL